MEPPRLEDVLAAKDRVYAHMRPSPLLHHPLLDEWVGCRVWVKHENHNPTGSFKVRGGFNLVGQLGDRERKQGVICREHRKPRAIAGARLSAAWDPVPRRGAGGQQPR